MPYSGGHTKEEGDGQGGREGRGRKERRKVEIEERYGGWRLEGRDGGKKEEKEVRMKGRERKKVKGRKESGEMSVGKEGEKEDWNKRKA